MCKPKENYINDEPRLPKLSKDFAINVKAYFEKKDGEALARKKRL